MRDNISLIKKILANRYEVSLLLGKGGMGEVYLAQDKRFGKEVVVKAPTISAADRDFKDRFMQEIASLATLEHPHIVPILDWGEIEGVPYLVLRYLAGGTLRDRITDANGQCKPMSMERLAQWLLPIASALDYIHSKGWIHRDLKPDNILFDEAGNPYLADFGIAKALEGVQADKKTTMGAILGTPQYMAPEMHMGRNIGPRGDQFGLGVMVYEALTGKVPFSGPTPTAIFWEVMQNTAIPIHEMVPEIPLEKSNALMRGLNRVPEQRYASCVELAQTILGISASTEGNPGQKITPWMAEGKATIKVHPSSPESARTQQVPAPIPGDDTTQIEGGEDGLDPVGRGAGLKKENFITEELRRDVTSDNLEAGVSRKANRFSPAFLLISCTVILVIGAALVSGRSILGQWWFGLNSSSDNQSDGDGSSSKTGDGGFQSKKSLEEILSSIENGFEFIPPGTFMMGSPVTETGREADEAQHEVKLTKAFYMARYETNQEQWVALMSHNPSSVKGPKLPVTNVSFSEAHVFIQRLNEKTKGGYRLPTEAEWEYACRAGARTAYSTGATISSDQATFEGDKPTPVGSYKPNAFGLYDMHGNVWEWCQDWYGPYPEGPVSDPLGPTIGEFRVIRGGSFFFPVQSLRSANRNSVGSPTARRPFLRGFRLARTVEVPSRGAGK